MKIYHQVGHNSNWNIESYGDDGAGDGLILAPRYMSREKIEDLGIPLLRIGHISTPNGSYLIPPEGNWKSIHFFQMFIVAVLTHQIMWGPMRINVQAIV